MGFLMKKTGIALLSAAVLAITSAASASSGLFGTAEAADTTNSTYNYGEALQSRCFSMRYSNAASCQTGTKSAGGMTAWSTTIFRAAGSMPATT